MKNIWQAIAILIALSVLGGFYREYQAREQRTEERTEQWDRYRRCLATEVPPSLEKEPSYLYDIREYERNNAKQYCAEYNLR